MTLVLARKFGGPLLVGSDTMISDLRGGRPEALPGQLKSIVIGQRLTVAYAGAWIPCLDAVRAAKHAFDRSGTTDTAIRVLVQSSVSGDCDFILATHGADDLPVLLKISAGRVAADATQHWIGDPNLIRPLAELETQHLGQALPDGWDPIYGSREQRAFRASFERLFDEAGVHADRSVGGTAIVTLGSRRGHTYLGRAFSRAWDTIEIGPGNAWSNQTAQTRADRASGMTSFELQIYTPKLRGVAIVGLYLPQSGVGYVHEPLLLDTPATLRSISSTDLVEDLNRRAIAAGGFPEPD